MEIADGGGRLRRPSSLPSMGGEGFLGDTELDAVPVEVTPFLSSARTSSTSVVCTTAQIDTSITRTSSMGADLQFQRHAHAAAASTSSAMQHSAQHRQRHGSFPSHSPKKSPSSITSSTPSQHLFPAMSAKSTLSLPPNTASLLSQALNLCPPSSAALDLASATNGAGGNSMTSPRPRRRPSARSKGMMKKLKYHEYRPPNSSKGQMPPVPSMTGPGSTANISNGPTTPAAFNNEAMALLMHQQTLLLQWKLLHARIGNPHRIILPAPPAVAERRRKEGATPGWVNGRIGYENVEWQKVSVNELRAELSRQGLPVSGKKAALIDRLKQHAEMLRQETPSSTSTGLLAPQLNTPHQQHTYRQHMMSDGVPSPSDSMSRSSMSALSPAATDMSCSDAPLSPASCATPQPDRAPSAPPQLDGHVDLDSSSEMSTQDLSPSPMRLWSDDSSVGSTASEQLRSAALTGATRPLAMRSQHHLGDGQHIAALNLLMPQEQHDLMMQLVQTQLADTQNQIVDHQHREFQQKQKEQQEERARSKEPSHPDLQVPSVISVSEPVTPHDHLQQQQQAARSERQREELDVRGRLRDMDFLASQNHHISEMQHEPKLRDRSNRRRSRSANQKRNSYVSSIPSKSGQGHHQQRQHSLPGHTPTPPVVPNPIPTTIVSTPASKPSTCMVTNSHPPLRTSKSFGASMTLSPDSSAPMLPLSPRSATTDTSLVSPLAAGTAIPCSIVQRTNSFSNSPKSPPIRPRARATSSSNPANGPGRCSRSLSMPNSPVQSPQHSPHSSQHNLNLVEERLPRSLAGNVSQPTAIPASPTRVNASISAAHMLSPRSSSPSSATQRSLSSPSGSYRGRSKTDSAALGTVSSSPLSFHEYPFTPYHPFGSPSSLNFGSPRSNIMSSSPGLSYSSQDLGVSELASSPGFSSASSLPSLAPWPGARSSSHPNTPQPRRHLCGSVDSCTSPLGHSPGMSPMPFQGHVSAAASSLADSAGIDRSPMSLLHHPRSSSFSGCLGMHDGMQMNVDAAVHSNSMDDLFDLINKEDMVSEMVFGDPALPLNHHGLDMADGEAGAVPASGGGAGGGGGAAGGAMPMAGMDDGSLQRTHSASNLYNTGEYSPGSMLQPYSSHPSLPMLGNMSLPSPIQLNITSAAGANGDDFMDVTSSPLGQSMPAGFDGLLTVSTAASSAVTSDSSPLTSSGGQQQKHQQQHTAPVTQHLQKNSTTLGGNFPATAVSTVSVSNDTDKLSWLDLSGIGQRLDGLNQVTTAPCLMNGVATHVNANMHSSISLGQLSTSLSPQYHHHQQQLLLQSENNVMGGMSYVPSYQSSSNGRSPWDFSYS